MTPFYENWADHGVWNLGTWSMKFGPRSMKFVSLYRETVQQAKNFFKNYA